MMACVLYGIQSKRTSHKKTVYCQKVPLTKTHPYGKSKRTPVISQNIVYKLYNINIYALILNNL